MSTPKRSTRSSSNTTDKNNDIAAMIVTMKQEIIETTKSEVKNVMDKLSHLEHRIDNLDNAFKLVSFRQEQQETEIAILNDKIENLKDNTSSELLEELQLRLSRSKNIIISGLPEQTEGNVDERREKDEYDVECLMRKMEMSDFDIQKISRLGKIREDRSRILRVVFSEEEEKTKALRKAKLLRSFGEYRRVYLNPDRTPSQQKQFARLRQELKAGRENGEDLVIFRDKIMKRKDVKDVQNFRQGF